MNKYVKLPFITNVIGYCGSGKSFFTKYLIKSFSSTFDCVVVFSNTAGFTKDYDFLKHLKLKSYIFSSLDVEDKIKQVMGIQKKNRMQNKYRNVLLIFDDIFGSITNSKQFKDLISTYRHYNISIIFSAQYVSGAVTYLREISNYIVLFNQRTQAALKLCFESYFAADFESFGDFKTDFVKRLQNYHFYFIDRIENTKQIMLCPA